MHTTAISKSNYVGGIVLYICEFESKMQRKKTGESNTKKYSLHVQLGGA